MTKLNRRYGIVWAGLVLILAVTTPCLSLAADKKKSNKEPDTIYVIRGGGGYFPNLGTVINEKFENQGLEVVDFRYHERGMAAKKIAAAYRAKELPHGIILIGYSLGGCGVIEVAKTLQAEGIPVRLLFLIETINPRIETPGEVRDRVLEAADYIPLGQLGTTDDCGFSPFCDDTSTTRETAFAKIRARVTGTALAAETLGKR